MFTNLRLPRKYIFRRARFNSFCALGYLRFHCVWNNRLSFFFSLSPYSLFAIYCYIFLFNKISCISRNFSDYFSLHIFFTRNTWIFTMDIYSKFFKKYLNKTVIHDKSKFRKYCCYYVILLLHNIQSIYFYANFWNIIIDVAEWNLR